VSKGNHLWVQVAISGVAFMVVQVLVGAHVKGIQIVLQVAIPEVLRIATCKPYNASGTALEMQHVFTHRSHAPSLDIFQEQTRLYHSCDHC